MPTATKSARSHATRGRKPLPDDLRMNTILTLRGKKEFKAWFDELILHCRIKRTGKDGADIMEKALLAWAKAQGFKMEAPPR